MNILETKGLKKIYGRSLLLMGLILWQSVENLLQS